MSLFLVAFVFVRNYAEIEILSASSPAATGIEYVALCNLAFSVIGTAIVTKRVQIHVDPHMHRK